MDKKQHICTVPGCNAQFARPYRLQNHLRKHAGERPFKCDEPDCDKAYTNQSHLRRHKLKSHSGVEDVQICPKEDCRKVLVSTTNLHKHMKNCHDKPYKCTDCSKSFKKKHQLQYHLHVHSEDAPKQFKCDLCPAEFAHITILKNHKRNHRSYTCSCGEIFHRWTVYLKHRRTSHTEKHICEICQKKFVCKRNYKIHLSVHQEERVVLECPMENCERLYYYKRNLMSHIKTYHQKIKMKPRLKKKSEKEKESITEKKPRKDIGQFKRSTALQLSGLEASTYLSEKALLAGKEITAENIHELLDSSDFSDFEAQEKTRA